MARNFDWRQVRSPQAGLFERWLYRYADTQCVGAQAWMRLVESLAAQFPLDDGPAPPGRQRVQEQRLAGFLNTLRSLRKRRRPRRLYIAYHQADIVEAKRLAHLANTLGMAYWLDAYDSLRHEPGMPQQALAGTLTAASIEMGLLNCSHAVVVARAPGSGIDWGAYQVARALYGFTTATGEELQRYQELSAHMSPAEQLAYKAKLGDAKAALLDFTELFPQSRSSSIALTSDNTRVVVANR